MKAPPSLRKPSCVHRRGLLGLMLGLALSTLPTSSWPPAARAEAGEAPTTRLRAELWGGDTFTGRGRWLHDAYIAHAVELEWRWLGPIWMGLRGLPALVYVDDPPIVGTALGITHRLYWTRDGAGLYAGPAIAVLVHRGHFEENSGDFNFLSSFEIGFQFPDSDLRLAAKLEHVSNAELFEENRGWNGIALLFGTTLWRAR